MKQSSAPHRGSRSFTLIELLVTLVIIGVLGTLVAFVSLRTRAKARAVKCMSNQQQIASALLSHYVQHGSFPPDGPGTDLAAELSACIPWPPPQRNVALPQVWRCPNDPGDKLRNSYQPYYVQRRDPTNSEYFVLGCPRHKDAEGCYINTAGISALARAKEGRTLVNGKEVAAEASTADRSMNNGIMSFEDNSTATVTTTSPGYAVTVVASFREETGRLYTIVRVVGDGETEFAVTPGSRFEVITPVAIIGVRGTEFTVRTENSYTTVLVTAGTVTVLDRNKGRKYLMNADDSLEIGPSNTSAGDQPADDDDDD